MVEIRLQYSASTESMPGADSSQAQRIQIARLAFKKDLAKALAGELTRGE